MSPVFSRPTVTYGITNPDSAGRSEQHPHRKPCAAERPPGIRNLTAKRLSQGLITLPIFGEVSGVSAMTGQNASLVGREGELSRLRELVAPPYEESRALLLLGDPGVGKPALLAEATREARSAGMRVLAAAGRESERDLAFAGLHQLLRPVLDRVAGLPARQAEAPRGAFPLSKDPLPPDALLTGIAVLTLLSGLSDAEPLLVAADDAQGLDRASLDALAFAARRLASEQLVLLA